MVDSQREAPSPFFHRKVLIFLNVDISLKSTINHSVLVLSRTGVIGLVRRAHLEMGSGHIE